MADVEIQVSVPVKLLHCKDDPSLPRFPHRPLHDLKGRGPGVQHGLVKPFLGEVLSPFSDGRLFQLQKFHIPDIVFQIIARVSEDKVVDVPYVSVSVMPKLRKKETVSVRDHPS